MQHRLHQTPLHGFLRDCQSGSNVMIAEFIELAQQKNITARFWHGENSSEQNIALLAKISQLIRLEQRAKQFFVERQRFDLAERITLVINGQVTSDPKQIGFRMRNTCCIVVNQQPYISFLRQFSRCFTTTRQACNTAYKTWPMLFIQINQEKRIK